jgi:hypothetical protein
MITDDDAEPSGGKPTSDDDVTNDADLSAEGDDTGDGSLGPASPATSRRTRATWLAAAVVFAASGFVLGFDRLTDEPTEVERRQDMAEVAESFTLALTNYDYRDLASTREQVLELSVRGFEQEFDRLLGGSGVQQALIDNQAVATATVAVGPLVADFGEHEARTFAVVEQSVAGAGAAPSQQRLRVEVLLVETPDGWVVTGAEVT